MEAVDYKRVAVVISGISLLSTRQDMMQRFADMFLQHEPRFDLVTFAVECGCSTVEVPISHVKPGDEIQEMGAIGKIRKVSGTVTFRIKRQGSVQFHSNERVVLSCVKGQR
jgi:hypothetical protein